MYHPLVFGDHTRSFSAAIWASTAVLQHCMIALWQLYEKQNGETAGGWGAEVVALLRESCFCDSVHKAMHGALNFFLGITHFVMECMNDLGERGEEIKQGRNLNSQRTKLRKNPTYWIK